MPKNWSFLCPLCLWLSLITPISFTAAARYGKGVYFALNASYSMQEKYSSAEKDGSKCILVCSLLVCKMTRGNEKMKVPPPIPDNPQVSPPAIKWKLKPALLVSPVRAYHLGSHAHCYWFDTDGCSYAKFIKLTVLLLFFSKQILYDTLVENVQNPTIFVAMKDSQAYPKYLIVFKKAWEKAESVQVAFPFL